MEPNDYNIQSNDYNRDRKEFDDEPEIQVRPSFLTVLCILTFIGSGWAIISSVTSYQTAGVTEASLKSTIVVTDSSMKAENSIDENTTINIDTAQVQERTPESGFELKMMQSVSQMFTKENIERSAIGSFIAALFTLGGAIAMWKLRRFGFYLYIIGVAIGVAVPLYLFGNNILAVGMSAFGSFFGLIFIALYALNLKAMRK